MRRERLPWSATGSVPRFGRPSAAGAGVVSKGGWGVLPYGTTGGGRMAQLAVMAARPAPALRRQSEWGVELGDRGSGAAEGKRLRDGPGRRRRGGAGLRRL